MSREVIKLNLIPKGEMPVFHASQFDTGRLITCELYNGDDAYNVPSGYTLELHCRKVDNNIVTMSSTSIDDNVVKFTSTEQLTACNGKNLCEVVILDDDYRIGTLNFWLEVEVDPLKGGITSTSEIHDLYEQIEDITTEIVGENYYTKTETDALLDDKADAATTYTKTEVDTVLATKADKSATYTKTQVDNLLSEKADSDDVYTKSQVETKLALKADAADVYTKTQVDDALALKADASDVYTKAQVETKLALKADAATTYTKTQVDDALALKADAADVYTKSQVDSALALKADADTTTAALATKADKSDTYTKEQVDTIIDSLFPTKTATGVVANFTTGITKKLVSCTVAEGATTIIHAGGNFFDKTAVTEGRIINGAGNDVSYAGWNVSDYIPVKEGASYYLSGLTDHPNTYQDNFIYFDSSKTKTGFENVRTTNYPLTVPSGVKYIKCTVKDSDINTAVFGLNAAPAYTPYVAVTTYPVADKDDIVTLAGENNLFADTGDITVQYKGV